MIITIQDTYLQLIKQGKKTVEGRINTRKYTFLKVGDVVTLKSDCDEVQVELTRLQRYDSFKAMIESVGLEALLPNVSSVEEGVELYRSFTNYAEYEKLYGCVAINIKLLYLCC